MMTEEAKKRIQLALALVIVLVAGRAGYIFYKRHEDNAAAQQRKQAKSTSGILLAFEQ